MLVRSDKLHGNTIDAVADIFVGKALTLKNMSQMTTAVGADNFYSPPIWVELTAHSALNFIVKAGPAAMGRKFVFRSVQGTIALFAQIQPLGFMIGILALKRPLCALVQDDILLFGI